MAQLTICLRPSPLTGWLRLLKEDIRLGGECEQASGGGPPPSGPGLGPSHVSPLALFSLTAAARGRPALLLYSADDAAFERLVGALASALCQLPLRVVVDLWSRRELSAQGPLAWFHAQRLQTLQEGGVVVLLFSPGAVALCREWLQDGSSAPRAHGPHDAFAASLSCVLPDFLQGRAPGRYIGAYFDSLLHPDSVPALFRAVPVLALPSQLPDFLRALQGPRAPRHRRLADKAEQVSQALQPALNSCLQSPGTQETGREMGPEAGDRT